MFKGAVIGQDHCPNYPGCKTLLRKGDVLELIHEDNDYDDTAVAVYWKGIKVGYLSNQGKSCTVCLASLKKKTTQCTQCGSFDLIDKGLSYRIVKSKWLDEPYVAYISEINLSSQAPFKFRMYLADEPDLERNDEHCRNNREENNRF